MKKRFDVRKIKQMYESGQYKDSKYLWICTPDGKYRYEIFSMQYANVNSDVYTLFSEHDDQFGAYVDKMAKQSESKYEDQKDSARTIMW